MAWFNEIIVRVLRYIPFADHDKFASVVRDRKTDVCVCVRNKKKDAKMSYVRPFGLTTQYYMRLDMLLYTMFTVSFDSRLINFHF